MKKLVASVALGMVLTFAGAASADPILTNAVLAVDFQSTTSPLGTQAGFQAFSAPTATAAIAPMTFGGITVTIAGKASGGSRNFMTNGGSYTYAALDDDGLTNFDLNKKTDVVTLLTLSGLTPSTQYQIQLWSFDPKYNNGEQDSWWDRTNGGNTKLGTITNVTHSAPYTLTDNNQFSVTALVTSDASGVLEFGYSIDNYALPAYSGSGGTLQGLVLSSVGTPTPEPASLGLLAIGGVFALARRRRH